MCSLSFFHRATLTVTRTRLQHLEVLTRSLFDGVRNIKDFNKAVARIPEVQICMMIAGSFDYMLKVRTRDMAHFRKVLGEQIGTLPGVMQTHSFAVMEVVKEEFSIKMSDI